jgi:homoserine dehydrogenase
MQEINVGLLGMGTVGEGVARLLIKNRELIHSRVGAPVHLKRVADIDVGRAQMITLENGVFTTDALSILNRVILDYIGTTQWQCAKSYELRGASMTSSDLLFM